MTHLGDDYIMGTLSMTRLEIEQRADDRDRMMLMCGSVQTCFRYALRRGWITTAENYCGD